MSSSHEKALKVKVKHARNGIGFDRKWKVLQGEAKKHGDKAVFFKGYDKQKRAHTKIRAEDIPF